MPRDEWFKRDECREERETGTWCNRAKERQRKNSAAMKWNEEEKALTASMKRWVENENEDKKRFVKGFC